MRRKIFFKFEFSATLIQILRSGSFHTMFYFKCLLKIQIQITPQRYRAVTDEILRSTFDKTVTSTSRASQHGGGGTDFSVLTRSVQNMIIWTNECGILFGRVLFIDDKKCLFIYVPIIENYDIIFIMEKC